MGEQAPFYIFTAFVFSYGVGTLHVSRDMLLLSVLIASCVSFITHPAGRPPVGPVRTQAHIPDWHVATRLFGWIYFAMLNTVMPFWVFIAVVASLIPHDTMYGPQAALIAESFTGRLRYSRSVDRLPACLDHRRRSGAADRHGAARDVP